MENQNDEIQQGNLGNNVQEGISTISSDRGGAVLQPAINTVEQEETEESPEEKELKQALIPFERFPKLKKWVGLFLDKSNKATYGNRTESAMQAYDCKDRVSAGNIGYQNYKKLYGLASILADDSGITVDKLINVAGARALTHENPKWFEIYTSMTGIYDPKAPSIVVNNNTQNNIDVTVNEADTINFNETFKKFVQEQ